MKRNVEMKVMAVLTAASILVGCGGSMGGSSSTTAASTAAGGAAETKSTETQSLLNLEGYPIVNEPITLKVGIQASSMTGIRTNSYEDVKWYQKIQEESGIDLEFIEYTSNEEISLMYASRDFPDITFMVGSDKQIQDAALGGDVYALDEYIDEYAPNWKAYFEGNPTARAQMTSDDGHIYSLPAIDESPQYRLRDAWYIRKDWLDELGLEVPKTTDEFYAVLKAFKENAGKGSIPEDVFPYYTRSVTSNIGGALDMVNSFGIPLSSETYRVTAKDGQIVFNYTNEAVKEPLEFLHKLMAEGLYAKEGLTEDRPTMQSRIDSGQIGSYTEYLPVISAEKVVVMGPLDSGNGSNSMMRTQANSVLRNRFVIYKTCKYPEIAMRLADMMADEKWSVESYYGIIGDNVKEEDGKYIIGPLSTEGAITIVTNQVPVILSEERARKLQYMEGTTEYIRDAAMKGPYADHLLEDIFPNFLVSDENLDRITELKNDCFGYIDRTWADWVVNGGIEEGWDEYIDTLHEYGLDELLTLLQEEYDRFLEKMPD